MTLRVLHAIHQGGGAGSVTSTLHLTLGLARAGVDIRLLCPPGSEVESLARAGGVATVPAALAKGRHRANAATLRAALDAWPAAVVNAQSSRDRNALALLRLARRLPERFVCTRRQMPLTFPLGNWAVSRLADRVIAVSEGVGAALVARGTPRARLAVIPNGLVLDRVDREPTAEATARWRARVGAPAGQRVLGIVARAKDQHVVLEALGRVRTPVRLVLAGVDPASGLGRRAAAVGAPHTVVCVAFDPEVRPLYDLVEGILLPSRIEGLSQTLLEAMALGIPVAASRAGGNPELLAHGARGRLVEPLDAAGWAAAVEAMLHDAPTTRALAAAGRAAARQEYALERTVERTRALYEELARGVRA